MEVILWLRMESDVSLCRCFVSPTYIQAMYQQLCCISPSIFQLAPNTIEVTPNIIDVTLFLYIYIYFL